MLAAMVVVMMVVAGAVIMVLIIRIVYINNCDCLLDVLVMM